VLLEASQIDDDRDHTYKGGFNNKCTMHMENQGISWITLIYKPQNFTVFS